MSGVPKKQVTSRLHFCRRKGFVERRRVGGVYFWRLRNNKGNRVNQ